MPAADAGADAVNLDMDRTGMPDATSHMDQPALPVRPVGIGGQVLDDTFVDNQPAPGEPCALHPLLLPTHEQIPVERPAERLVAVENERPYVAPGVAD